MPALHITTPGTRVALVSQRLQITPPPGSAIPDPLQPADQDTPPDPAQLPLPPDATTYTVHLHDIDRITLTETAHITTPTIAELLRRQIPLILLDNCDNLLGHCLPPAHHTPLRAAQYHRTLDHHTSLAIAATLIEAKILNQRRILQRLAHNRPHLHITPTLDALAQHAQHAATAPDHDTLRGHEGAAAALYFTTYATFYPPHIPFERRTRRPPHNPPNAILSYTYTLLTAECTALLHAHGLDPACGFYHSPEPGRPALALDLIEPFRAPIADALALDLLTHGTLQPDKHFTHRDGGCYLNHDAKKRYFTAYERRLERPYTSEQHGQRTTLRNELDRQIQSLKHTITHNEPLIPFRIN
jgi:CRISPR-associated protein Cas1